MPRWFVWALSGTMLLFALCGVFSLFHGIAGLPLYRQGVLIPPWVQVVFGLIFTPFSIRNLVLAWGLRKYAA